MDKVNKEELCSKFAEKIIEIMESIPSDSKINVDFSSNGDIRLTNGSQKWLIVSDEKVYKNRLTIDRKRPSNINSFTEVNKNHYKLDGQSIICVELESSEREFLSKYINNNKKRSIKFDNKAKLREYFEDFDKSYKNSDYSICPTLDEYNNFIDFVEEKIDIILHKYPDQYDCIGIEIKNKSLALYFNKGRCNSDDVILSFVGAEEGAGTKENCFVFSKINQVIGFIKNKQPYLKSNNHVQFFNNKNELLKYFEKLFYYSNSEISIEYSEELLDAETENANKSYLYGFAGLSTTLVPLLYNITTSNKSISATNTSLQNISISDNYNESSYGLTYITTAISTAISSAFIFFVIGFICYKYHFQRGKSLGSNSDTSVTAIDQLEASNVQQIQVTKNSSDVSISIQEENQTSIESEEQLTSDEENRRSTTPIGDEQHLSQTTSDQESEVRSTSSGESTTSSSKSRSASTSKGSKQQQLGSKETITESSEKLSTSAESLKSSLEEVEVVESSQKPKAKPRSVYPNICQC